jgi:hypothetical protein
MVIDDQFPGDSTTIVLDARNVAQLSPVREHVSLRIAQGEGISSQMAWESFASIGVIVHRPVLGVGDVVEVEYGGLTMPARVSAVEEQPDHSWLAVLSWARASRC